MIDLLLFGVFPYLAVILAISVSLYRFFVNPYSYSSLSSQFLEGRQLFLGSVPWHFGIGLVLIGHLIGILLPSSVKAFNGEPLRLYILEATALGLGLLALTGLVLLLIRRASNTRIRAVTSRMDVVLLAVLLLQVVAGVGISIFNRWGIAWYVQTAVPWLWSLATLSPDWSYMVNLPFLVKLHALNAFVLVALIPFTRLIHLVSAPLPYLWRPYQVVVWTRQRRAIRGAAMPSAVRSAPPSAPTPVQESSTISARSA